MHAVDQRKLRKAILARKQSPRDGVYTFEIPYFEGIIHVEAGIKDWWEPTPEELDKICGLFMQAQEDPKGAVVVVRSGIKIKTISKTGKVQNLRPKRVILSDMDEIEYQGARRQVIEEVLGRTQIQTIENYYFFFCHFSSPCIPINYQY
jgi:hypothetical protein